MRNPEHRAEVSTHQPFESNTSDLKFSLLGMSDTAYFSVHPFDYFIVGFLNWAIPKELYVNIKVLEITTTRERANYLVLFISSITSVIQY